ncbi:hypothetical protein CP533_2247 [Ophiocordyceps camponoti-saundersi (nom. inval.)]|nr:hypothetical protein CP533_2247 [Ophiocordyceps camponoti-saundersi (nom. inval.)]
MSNPSTVWDMMKDTLFESQVPCQLQNCQQRIRNRIQKKPELVAQAISLLLREELDSELAPPPKRRLKEPSSQPHTSVFDDAVKPSKIEGSPPPPPPIPYARQWEQYAARNNLAYLPSNEALWDDDLGEIEVLEIRPSRNQQAAGVASTSTVLEDFQVPEVLPELPPSFSLDQLSDSVRNPDISNAPTIAETPGTDFGLALSILPEDLQEKGSLSPLDSSRLTPSVKGLPTLNVPTIGGIPETDLELALSELPGGFEGEEVFSPLDTSEPPFEIEMPATPDVPTIIEELLDADLDYALSIIPDTFQGKDVVTQPVISGASTAAGGKPATKEPIAEELLKGLPSVPQHDPSRDRKKAADKGSRSKQKLPKQCCSFNSRKRDCIPCPQLKGESPPPKSDARKPVQKFTPQSFKELAKAKAQEEFKTLAKRLKLPSLETVKAMARLREDFNLRIPSKIKAWISKASPGIFLLGASLPFYIADVVETFQRNSTDLEKAAAVTVMLPILGCSARLASELGKGETGAILGARISLCFAGDLLLFTPAFPVAIMLHMLSSSMGGLQLLDPNFVKTRRDEAWNKHYQTIIDHYSSKEWDTKVGTWYLDEMTNISITVSEQRGTLDAVKVLAQLQEDAGDTGPAELELVKQYNATERTFCTSLRSSRRQLEKELPGATWLSAQATSFNKKYIKLYESQAAVHHRMTPEKHRYVSHGMPMLWVPSGFQKTLNKQFRSKIDPVVETLKKTVMDQVKLEEFAETVQSRTLKIMTLPSECDCSVNIDDIESAGVKPPCDASEEQLAETLLCAASKGYNDVIEKLMTWSINLDVTDEDGNTALILAVKNGYEDTAQLLLKLQDAIWTGGETLLSEAKASEHPPQALTDPSEGLPWNEWIDKNRKWLGVRNLAGVTALEMARVNGLDKVVELIQRATGMTSGALSAHG